MPTPPPPLYTRAYNFRQAELARLPFAPVQVDTELNRVGNSLNQAVELLRGMVDANGNLIFQRPLREMKLYELLSFTATAAQTQFYIAPITDVLTDRVEVRVNDIGSALYRIVDQTAISLAQITTVGGTLTCTYLSNTYETSATLPDTIVGASVDVNGVDIGTVTVRVDDTHFQTTTAWPNPNSVEPTWTWSGLAQATVAFSPSLLAGQEVQFALYTDGAGALSLLGSPGPASGARAVAVMDVGGLYLATNVEDALQEVAAALEAYKLLVGPLADYLRADGTIPMAADLDFDGFQTSNLAPATLAGHAVEFSQIQQYLNAWNDLQLYYLKLDGSTPMLGPLDLGGNRATNAANAVASTDLVTLSQAQGLANTAALRLSYMEHVASFEDVRVASSATPTPVTSETAYFTVASTAVSDQSLQVYEVISGQRFFVFGDSSSTPANYLHLRAISVGYAAGAPNGVTFMGNKVLSGTSTETVPFNGATGIGINDTYVQIWAFTEGTHLVKLWAKARISGTSVQVRLMIETANVGTVALNFFGLHRIFRPAVP